MSAANGSAASSGSIISATVPSAITVSVDGCAGDSPATSFGTILPGTSTTTTNDCQVSFGSSNDTASLTVRQADGTGTAMSARGTATQRRGDYTWNDVDFSDATTAWAVGSAAMGSTTTVVRSTDTGDTWSAASTQPTSAPLYSVDALSGSEVYVSGFGAWRTNDGGGSWALLPGTAALSSLRLDVVNSSDAWLVSYFGTVYHWNGATAPALRTDASERYGAVSATSSSTVTVAGTRLVTGTWQPMLIQTTDGGATWNDIPLGGTGFTSGLTSVTALGATDLWVTGATRTCHTVNSGGTWTCVASGGSSLEVRGATLWRTDTVDQIGRSTDSGGSWASTTLSPANDIYYTSIDSGSANDVIAVGYANSIQVSHDGGVTFTSTRGPSTNWNSIAAWDLDNALLFGGGGLVARTTNSGVTWTAPASGTTQTLRASTWIDASTVVAAGSNGAIVRSTDGGASFAPMTSGSTAQLNAIDGHVGNTLWAGGNGGALLVSRDSGATWTPRPVPTAEDIVSVAGIDAQTAWAITKDDGVVYRTSNGGNSWNTMLDLPATATGLQVIAPTSSVIWVTGVLLDGTGMVLRRSVDAGATWTTQSPAPTTSCVPFVAAFGAGTLRVDYCGHQAHTYDGGASWTVSATGGSTIKAAVALGPHRAWVSGNSDTVTQFAGGAAVGDYGGAATWASGNALFGACLRSVAGDAAVATWLNAGGTCAADDGTPWNPISAAPAVIARVPSGGTNGIVNLRFGMHVEGSSTPATYVAPLQFEALAPGA
jgi:photosystem II stability/assembly factor-like uncharacterized protein